MKCVFNSSDIEITLQKTEKMPLKKGKELFEIAFKKSFRKKKLNLLTLQKIMSLNRFSMSINLA